MKKTPLRQLFHMACSNWKCCTLVLGFTPALATAGSNERRIIAGALFKVHYDDVPSSLNYSYNIWGANPGLYSFYQGGHGGLDIQTWSVAASKTADETFFAVSRGEVITRGEGKCKTIAIYDSAQNLTTFYLHARQVFDLPNFVEVGEKLGIQGDSCAAGAEHVHLEVRMGRVRFAGNGANFSVDPEPYLVNYVSNADSPARLAATKASHWARREIANAIHLGIMKNGEGSAVDDRAWKRIDQVASRGELVTILKAAAEAYDPNYFSGLPDVNSPPFFVGDSSLQSSSHRDNVILFGRKGLVSTSNSEFLVNNTVTQGEMVLMAWRLFQLGSVSQLPAVDAYKIYRKKLRAVTFKRPKFDTYLIPSVYERSSYGFYRRVTDNILLQHTSPKSLFIDETGICDLNFSSLGADVYKEGYSIPATRASVAKLVINAINFRATYPSNWRNVMDSSSQ